ncbi:MAG: diguanylate cyclase domain-containing protein [Acidimicrobiales bacterium]
MLAALFCVCEIVVVHLHFRAHAHSISMGELPLVLGLFFASPDVLVLAQIVGAAVALIAVRRQNPLKLGFNLTNLALQCVIAQAVFLALIAGRPVLSAPGWGYAIVATLAAAIVGIAAIVGAIVLSHSDVPLRRSAQTFALGLAATFSTTNLAVVAGGAVATRLYLIAPLTMVAVAVAVAYRAYGAERSRRDSLEVLYRASQVTQGTGDLDEILVSLLEYVREMFHSRAAELVMLADDNGHGMLRTTVGLAREPEVMVESESVLTAVAVRAAAASDTSIVAMPGDGSGHGEAVGNLLVARLGDENRLLGALVAASPADAVSMFRPDQLQLFKTLASQVTMTLVNGKLERSIAQLRELQRQLTHKAFHDPLTGLANREMFRGTLQDALDSGRGGLAVLFIDLDDFKTVNDTLGHSSGDRLLHVAGSRIENCARVGDLAARLGGDEFAVLLHGVTAEEAEVVADRILFALKVAAIIDNHHVSARASIGVVLVDGGGNAETYMSNADIAMYSAKRHGKGCYEFFASEMSAAVVSRHELKEDLNSAVMRREFTNHYQPIVSLATGSVIGIEALVR